ncbi:O-antigen ligase family protein [Brevundimonas sp.]|uniref:O-antigen ligase family protein n=1 Tax=Brevundimonas sp. TaxID=1871086 RepID=UPI00182A8E9D|nr:O-antigen ligase family protein [Brevundimonas sp.]MBA4808589.1 O-antigen ligase family protein [Brevundimonas sp.]
MTATANDIPARKSGGRPLFVPAVATLIALFVLVVLGPAMTNGGPPSGNILRQAIFTALLLGTMWAAGVFKKPSKLLSLPIILMAAVAWCWISVAWSDVPMISVRRVLLTTIIIWIVFLAVDDCGYDRTVKTIMVGLAVLLFINFIAVAVSPATAIHHFTAGEDRGLIGDWRGVLPQKNFTGEFCAFTILFFTFAPPKLPRKTQSDTKAKVPRELIVGVAIRTVVVLAAAFFLFKTESKTSMGMAAMGLLGGAMFLFLSPRARMIAVPFAALAGMAVMLFWADSWVESVGPFAKPTAFTGRVQIWPHLISYIRDHPLNGSGYGAFWNIGDESPIFTYSKTWVTTIASGHNGYLDLAAQVGIPGLILAVVAAFVMPLYKLLSSQSVSRWRGALLIGMIIFCVGHNMTESGLFDRDVIVWAFLLITLALTEVATGKRLPSSSSKSRPRSRRKRALPSFD